MKIKKAEFWKETYRLEESSRFTSETVEKFNTVFTRVVTDKGITGVASVSPDRAVQGESAGDVMEKLEKYVEPSLHGLDLSRYIHILETVKKMVGDSPSTLCLVDTVLHDLMARSAGLPLYKLLGGYRDYIRTSVTIGILPSDETVKRTSEWIRKGFEIIKLKGGTDVQEDIEKVNLLRDSFGKKIILRFDADQGYTMEDAVKFINGTKKADIELFEQPTPRDKPDWLGYLTRKAEVPVMADESITNLKDAYFLSRNKLADLINIKLVKVGGITEALHISSVARAAGIRIMVGCTDECALGIAAGVHFALSRPEIAYADLDGHLGVMHDPTRGAVEIRGGIIYPNRKPGLGFRL